MCGSNSDLANGGYREALRPTTGHGLTRKGPSSPSPFSSSFCHHVSLEKHQNYTEAREVSRVQNVSRHSRLRVAPGSQKQRPHSMSLPRPLTHLAPVPALHLGPSGQGHRAGNGEPLLTSRGRASVSIAATQVVGQGGGGEQPKVPAWSLGRACLTGEAAAFVSRA